MCFLWLELNKSVCLDHNSANVGRFLAFNSQKFRAPSFFPKLILNVKNVISLSKGNTSGASGRGCVLCIFPLIEVLPTPAAATFSRAS